MKKIWKRLTVVLLSVVMLAVITSCGKKDQEPDDNDGQVSDQGGNDEDGHT